jgi:hypothetical protein
MITLLTAAFLLLASLASAEATCHEGFFANPPLNIGIVIDTSYSTYDTTFSGTEVGDVNEDGKRNTILDAEIAAVLALLQVILENDGLDNSNMDIGIIEFDTGGRYEGNFAPLNSDNTAVNPALKTHLENISSMKSSYQVRKYNKGYTNFDDALDKSIEYFSSVPDDRTNLMVFLSDGKPNVRGDGDNEGWCPASSCWRAPGNKQTYASTPAWKTGELSFCYWGDKRCRKNNYADCARNNNGCLDADVAKTFDSELAELDRLQVNRLSIGVGSESDVSNDSGLWRIDNNPRRDSEGILPQQVFTTDDLIDTLSHLCPELQFTDVPVIAPTPSPIPDPTAAPVMDPTDAPIAPTDAPITPAAPSNPNIMIEKTVHLGKLLKCFNGSELQHGVRDQVITYCYKVTNTGNIALVNVHVTDDSVGTDETLTEDPLAPGKTMWVRKISSISDNLKSMGAAVGSPDDGGADVQHADDAGVMMLLGPQKVCD